MPHRWPRPSPDTAPSVPDKPDIRAITTATANLRVPSLASATRDYAHALTIGTFRRLDAGDLIRLHLAMGPEIWAWQYALRLTGQPPWRAGSNEPETIERARAARQMLSDIATWERALAELDADADRARAYGKHPPDALDVPAVVAAVITARRQANLERATRRSGRTERGGEAPAPKPEGSTPGP